MREAGIRAWMGWSLACCGLAAALLAAPARADIPRPAQGPLGEREVTVLNGSPRPINEIYVSPESAEQWGEDRLGDQTLDPGDLLRLRLGRTRECIFDAKVVYDDASREETRGLNLCRIHQINFDGSTATAPPETGVEHSVTSGQPCTAADSAGVHLTGLGRPMGRRSSCRRRHIGGRPAGGDLARRLQRGSARGVRKPRRRGTAGCRPVRDAGAQHRAGLDHR